MWRKSLIDAFDCGPEVANWLSDYLGKPGKYRLKSTTCSACRPRFQPIHGTNMAHQMAARLKAGTRRPKGFLALASIVSHLNQSRCYGLGPASNSRSKPMLPCFWERHVVDHAQGLVWSNVAMFDERHAEFAVLLATCRCLGQEEVQDV